VARAAYVKAIAENNAKNQRHRMQLLLRCAAERATPRAEVSIRAAYGSAPADQAELRSAIDRIITHPPRKAALSKLLAP